MQNPGFLTLAAKLIVNVHDMNNEGSIGQTTDIRTVRMVGEDGKELGEAPAVSGRMMKHWHLAYMLREELNNSTPKLCPQCKTWEPERKPQDEGNGINVCVICDAHGFLCTDKPGFKAKVSIKNDELILTKEATDDTPEELFNVIPCGHDKSSPDTNCPTCELYKLDNKTVSVTGEISEEDDSKTLKVAYISYKEKKTTVKKGTSPKGLSLRRSSCVNFSWLLPVLDVAGEVKQVIHSRVASAAGEGDEKSSQMIFYKNYASSIYAFVCSIDLDRIGKPLIGNGLSDTVEIKRRRQMAVKALLPMVMGAFGASQSHALPHTKCIGVLAALSDNSTPIPNLISPIYNNGFKESIKMIQTFDNNKVKYWGYGEADEGTPKTESIQIPFECILSELK